MVVGVSEEGFGLHGVDEDFSGSGAVALADDALVFHEVEEPGGSLEADAEPSLEEGGAGLSFFGDEPDGFWPEVVGLGVLVFGVGGGVGDGDFFGFDGVDGFALGSPELADVGDFFF